MLGIFGKQKKSVPPRETLKTGTGTGMFQLYISLYLLERMTVICLEIKRGGVW